MLTCKIKVPKRPRIFPYGSMDFFKWQTLLLMASLPRFSLLRRACGIARFTRVVSWGAHAGAGMPFYPSGNRGKHKTTRGSYTVTASTAQRIFVDRFVVLLFTLPLTWPTCKVSVSMLEDLRTPLVRGSNPSSDTLQTASNGQV